MTPTRPVPPSRREEVVDDYHGVAVPDPYRWLEVGDDPEVRDWVAAQNSFTDDILGALPDGPAWRDAVLRVMMLPVVGDHAVLRAGTLFCTERPTGAEQLQLRRHSATDRSDGVTLVDPGSAAADSATAVDWFEPSDDGALIAVGTSDGGTEHSVLRVISTADGSVAGGPHDEIPDTRACSVAWEPDSSGFFYTRYPAGDEYHRTVHHHRLGDDWRTDPVVWAEHPDPQAWPQVALSPDGRWLVVHVMVGWQRVDVHVLDRTTDEWTDLAVGVEANTELSFTADGTSLIGLTDLDASRGRVVRIALDPAVMTRGPDAWETLVAERDDVIAGFAVTADGLVMVTSRAAVNEVWRLDPDGRPVDDGHAVSGLPDASAVLGTASSFQSADMFVVVDSFASPTALWRIPGGSGLAEPWIAADAAKAGVGELTVRQIEYPSADGTMIGLFVVHRTDVVPGPDVPTILDGYGGFGVTRSPVWSPQVGAWCGAGGVFAVAGLRGGNEHGEEWHRAGSRAHKQNVFDDFHAAADFLVDEGLASRERLAVHGGSNGGLLVGAALTQRPGLCQAVWCRVPLLDMVRFPQFLIARLWTSEYGDPDVAEEFAWVHAYSPYHHVVAGTCYPATFVHTAEGDSRVDPLHARKMVALLQSASSCLDDRPIVLRQEGRAGHGVGKPVSMRAAEMAEGLTFIASTLGASASVELISTLGASASVELISTLGASASVES